MHLVEGAFSDQVGVLAARFAHNFDVVPVMASVQVRLNPGDNPGDLGTFGRGVGLFEGVFQGVDDVDQPALQVGFQVAGVAPAWQFRQGCRLGVRHAATVYRGAPAGQAGGRRGSVSQLGPTGLGDDSAVGDDTAVAVALTR